jgi:hypothetical protein
MNKVMFDLEVVNRMAAQSAAAERNKLAAWMMAQGYATGHGDTMEDLLAELDWQVKERVGAERNACAKVAGWLWQQFQDTKEAHERNSPEPFRPERFGFDHSTVQQSKRLMDAINARSQA